MMSAKSKLVLAILAVALLFLNPIGACASMPVVSAPAHPCCPETPVVPEDCAKPGCVGINPAPIPVLVSTNSDQGQVSDVTADTAAEGGLATERHTLTLVRFAAHDRYLTIHQLRL
jgi:hypothetical protein